MDRLGSVWIELNGVPAIAPQNGSLAYCFQRSRDYPIPSLSAIA
jgi:hypothetical protein